MIKNLSIGKGSNRTLLLVALGLGLLTAVLIGVFLSTQGGDSGGQVSGATVQAVVASQNVPAGTRLTEDMVKVQAVPSDLALAGVFTDAKTAVGQVTEGALVAGDQITSSKVTTSQVALAQFGANAPLSLLVPTGMRAFSVAISETGSAGGLIRAGDYVDVILSNPKTATDAQSFLTPGAACFVAQDVQVLAVGTNVKAAAGTDSTSIASSATDTEATAATLAVTPQQAWWLAAAQTKIKDGGGVENQLWLSLRPFGERGQVTDLPVCGVVPGQ